VVSLVLIDDSAAERMLLRARLEETGRFDVVGEAADGRQGIELVRTLRPDHVVFDLSIAGMDGLDVVSQLRDLAPRALITIVSGHVSPSLRRAVLNRGATACLDKNASLRWLVDELLFHAFHEPSSELGPPVSSRAIQRCGRSRDGELRRDPARGG
jgi:DNA-binding NarL/FixJ family response regulator